MFKSIIEFTNDGQVVGQMPYGTAAILVGIALVLGALIAAVEYFCNKSSSKNFVISLALLPVIVLVVILMVNGNLGVGIAIAGAFSLVRFRSIPGTAKDIMLVFFAMAVGLCLGVGFVTFAIVFCIVVCIAYAVIGIIPLERRDSFKRVLKIAVPEDLCFDGLFDDLFKEYLIKSEVKGVKTTNLGTMYELSFIIELKDEKKMKEFIDKIRTRNGNLNVNINKVELKKDSL